jgi:hypothetical protein
MQWHNASGYAHATYPLKFVWTYLSRRGNSFDHAHKHRHQDPRNNNRKCNLPVESFWTVDVLRNHDSSLIPDVLCWSACLKYQYMAMNTQQFSWTHITCWFILKVRFIWNYKIIYKGLEQRVIKCISQRQTLSVTHTHTYIYIYISCHISHILCFCESLTYHLLWGVQRSMGPFNSIPPEHVNKPTHINIKHCETPSSNISKLKLSTSWI